MTRRVLGGLGALALAVSMTGAALAHTPPDDQHGSTEEHLPASRENMRVVAKLQLTDKQDGIADVSFFKGHAYLAAWSPECPNGGVHVVDISDPRSPQKVGFAASGPDSRPGEGVDIFHMDTRFWTGDILVMNNEACAGSVTKTGGVTLYDVSNPSSPKLLAKGVGDTDANDPEDPTPLEAANYVHSSMGWSVGNKAYVVMTDNEELLDVDILDVTNPFEPRLIAETGLADWPNVVVDAYGDESFHHDMWVKEVDGEWLLLLSYWDAGYIVLNVDDPSNPRLVKESDYPETDLLGFSPPEGNGHQAVWNWNNEWILGADEDFAARRGFITITTGANQGEFIAGEFSWTEQIHKRFAADQQANGTVVYGGRGCPGDPPPPPASTITVDAGEERMVVFTRGTCFFSEKVEMGQNAGYDVVIVGNHHIGAQGGEAPDSIICGSMGHEFEVRVSGICIGHRAMHQLFNDPPEYDPTQAAGADLPAIGTVGEELSFRSQFDGWGYLNLIDADTMEVVDVYAVPEAIDQRFEDIVPLSIHETKTDRRRGVNLAYASWYKAGARVISFGNGGLREVGHFIDEGGSNFWGTYPVKRPRKPPLLLFSDRDYGLYILTYTGPQP